MLSFGLTYIYKPCYFQDHFCSQCYGSLLNTFCYPAHAYICSGPLLSKFSPPLYLCSYKCEKKEKNIWIVKTCSSSPYKIFRACRRLFQRNVIFHSFHICNFISTTMNHSPRLIPFLEEQRLSKKRVVWNIFSKSHNRQPFVVQQNNNIPKNIPSLSYRATFRHKNKLGLWYLLVLGYLGNLHVWK